MRELRSLDEGKTDANPNVLTEWKSWLKGNEKGEIVLRGAKNMGDKKAYDRR